MPRDRAAGRSRPVTFLLPLLAAVLLLPAGWPLAQSTAGGWVTVDYGDVVDTRRLSHSGEPVGALLERLGGRPAPRPGERPADAVAHVLLDPLLEPHAFVLPDVIDSGAPVDTDRPFVDVGRLWAPGEERPAWADLLRDGAYVVESDGRGRVRAFVPVADDARPSAESAAEGWRDAWPVLRHALAAIARSSGATEGLDVSVHPFVHRPARTEFRLGLTPHAERIAAFGPDGRRAPVDIDGWRELLGSGLQIEGGRLALDGSLTLIASRPDVPPALAGRPVSLADVAVAYRAVFHAPGDEPYMSLDRAPWPHVTAVNYGGRLGDTALGLVSLLCDIRFKTFSVGLDVTRGADVREDVRARVERFATHLERLSAHPESGAVTGQQTRLWFYPDSVEMTLSPRGDLMALSRARMAAASERKDPAGSSGGAAPDPPWTRATVAAIDADYDALAALFPEMADLDQVVRLLSLFAWLRAAEAGGARIPDLDALLAETLPALSTPREYPQLLAFNALPPVGGDGPVEAIGRADIVEALERLRPANGRVLPPATRFARARAQLEPRLPQHARLLEETAAIDPQTAPGPLLDVFAHGAERLAMHRHVLTTLTLDDRRRLGQRQLAEGRLRVFSVGIGGLDLSMAKAVRKASGRAAPLSFGGRPLGVAQATSGRPPARAQQGAARAPFVPPAAWKEDPPGLATASLPAHRLAAERRAQRAVSVEGGSLAGTSTPRRHLARATVSANGGTVTVLDEVHDPLSADVSARRIVVGANGRARAFTRRDGGRVIHYGIERAGDERLAVRRIGAPLPPAVAASLDTWFETAPARADKGARAPGPGVVVLTIAAGQDPVAETVRVTLAAGGGRSEALDLPRAALRIAAAGPGLVREEADPPAPLVPLPASFADATRVIVADRAPSGWSAMPAPRPGEEDAAHLALGLAAWLAKAAGEGAEGPVALVAASPPDAEARATRAVTDGAPARLVLRPNDLAGASAASRERLVTSWSGPAGPLPAAGTAMPALVVVVSDEAPAPLAARLDELASRDAMRDRTLLVVTVGRPLARSLPARLLARGRLAGVGVLDAGPTGLPATLDRVAAIGAAAAAAGRGTPVGRLGPGIAWHH